MTCFAGMLEIGAGVEQDKASTVQLQRILEPLGLAKREKHGRAATMVSQHLGSHDRRTHDSTERREKRMTGSIKRNRQEM
jgi:hypothetical protein